MSSSTATAVSPPAAKGELHRRLSAFTAWIATDPDREDDLRDRAKDLRESIGAKAREDGLVVRATPAAGSFATRTGLRRHMRGESEVEGQDVDVPFVIAPATVDEDRLDVLLPRFEKYARETYPETERERTNSSIKLKFSDKVNFDIVPLFATKDPELQIVVRADGERHTTSVQKHVEFVRARTKRSDLMAGRVKFNEIVRLLKWWRCLRQDRARTIQEIPSFLVNLLAAYAFDYRGVRTTYGETVADWFGFLARIVRTRTAISFADFGPKPLAPTAGTWAVKDPVNPDNNLVDGWSGTMCDELVDWLDESRDQMYEAIAAFDDDRENDGVACLVRVFGNAIRHHSEAEQ